MAGTAEQTQLLDELANLLKKQNQQAQQGSISEVEQLGKQADSIVKKISQTRILDSVKFKNKKEKLQKLYGDLCLAVTAQKAGAAEQLSEIRRVRKTIGAYKDNA
ncbi:MAG: hypothetical protein KAQ89_06690 [Planctomycetes bacterium]|nr:hypothetical protein [Planctomycetota bacterium]